MAKKWCVGGGGPELEFFKCALYLLGKRMRALSYGVQALGPAIVDCAGGGAMGKRSTASLSAA
jgi:hypothetical protein